MRTSQIDFSLVLIISRPYENRGIFTRCRPTLVVVIKALCRHPYAVTPILCPAYRAYGVKTEFMRHFSSVFYDIVKRYSVWHRVSNALRSTPWSAYNLCYLSSKNCFPALNFMKKHFSVLKHYLNIIHCIIQRFKILHLWLGRYTRYLALATFDIFIRTFGVTFRL